MQETQRGFIKKVINYYVIYQLMKDNSRIDYSFIFNHHVMHNNIVIIKQLKNVKENLFNIIFKQFLLKDNSLIMN